VETVILQAKSEQTFLVLEAVVQDKLVKTNQQTEEEMVAMDLLTYFAQAQMKLVLVEVVEETLVLTLEDKAAQVEEELVQIKILHQEMEQIILVQVEVEEQEQVSLFQEIQVLEALASS
jgi:hypothetical protein